MWQVRIKLILTLFYYKKITGPLDSLKYSLIGGELREATKLLTLPLAHLISISYYTDTIL